MRVRVRENVMADTSKQTLIEKVRENKEIYFRFALRLEERGMAS